MALQAKHQMEMEVAEWLQAATNWQIVRVHRLHLDFWRVNVYSVLDRRIVKSYFMEITDVGTPSRPRWCLISSQPSVDLHGGRSMQELQDALNKGTPPCCRKKEAKSSTKR